jgi:hypothetical protein
MQRNGLDKVRTVLLTDWQKKQRFSLKEMKRQILGYELWSGSVGFKNLIISIIRRIIIYVILYTDENPM